MEASGELLGRARAQAGKFSIMKISWILSTLELSDDTKKMKTNLLLMTTHKRRKTKQTWENLLIPFTHLKPSTTSPNNISSTQTRERK